MAAMEEFLIFIRAIEIFRRFLVTRGGEESGRSNA
jgi:hypothetical protein